MRGYVLTRYGDADAMQLRDVPEPSPRPGELLIQRSSSNCDHAPVDRPSPRSAPCRPRGTRSPQPYFVPCSPRTSIIGSAVALSTITTRSADAFCAPPTRTTAVSTANRQVKITILEP